MYEGQDNQPTNENLEIAKYLDMIANQEKEIKSLEGQLAETHKNSQNLEKLLAPEQNNEEVSFVRETYQPRKRAKTTTTEKTLTPIANLEDLKEQVNKNNSYITELKNDLQKVSLRHDNLYKRYLEKNPNDVIANILRQRQEPQTNTPEDKNIALQNYMEEQTVVNFVPKIKPKGNPRIAFPINVTLQKYMEQINPRQTNPLNPLTPNNAVASQFNPQTNFLLDKYLQQMNTQTNTFSLQPQQINIQVEQPVAPTSETRVIQQRGSERDNLSAAGYPNFFDSSNRTNVSNVTNASKRSRAPKTANRYKNIAEEYSSILRPLNFLSQTTLTEPQSNASQEQQRNVRTPETSLSEESNFSTLPDFSEALDLSHVDFDVPLQSDIVSPSDPQLLQQPDSSQQVDFNGQDIPLQSDIDLSSQFELLQQLDPSQQVAFFLNTNVFLTEEELQQQLKDDAYQQTETFFASPPLTSDLNADSQTEPDHASENPRTLSPNSPKS